MASRYVGNFNQSTKPYANGPANPFAIGDFSIGIWFAADNPNNGYLVGCGNYYGANGSGFAVMNRDKGVSFVLNNGTAAALTRASNQVPIVPGSWYHVTLVIERSKNVTFYINGVWAGSASISDKQGSLGASPLRLAKQGLGAGWFGGKMRTVKFYDSLLNAMDAMALYENKPAISDVPELHWEIDEGAVDVLNDSSGNGYDATVTNADIDEFWVEESPIYTYVMRPDAEPLNSWPPEVGQAETVIFIPGDYRNRGPLILRRNKQRIHHALPDHPAYQAEYEKALLPSLRFLDVDGVHVRGLNHGGISEFERATNCVVDSCEVIDSPVIPYRFKDHSQHNTIKRCLIARETAPWPTPDVVGAIPAGTDGDGNDSGCYFNEIDRCTILNHTDQVQTFAKRNILSDGAAAGCKITNCFLGFTEIAYEDNNTVNGEQAGVDFKTGGTAENPLELTGNVIFGQRRNINNAINQAVVLHLSCRHVRINANIFSDCDACISLSPLHTETPGGVDFSNPDWIISGNLFSRVYQTTTEAVGSYPEKTGGRVFTGSNTASVTDNEFLKCEHLAAEVGREIPIQFVGNRAYGDMGFEPSVNIRPYSREQWLKDGNAIIDNSAIVERMIRVPFTDIWIRVLMPDAYEKGNGLIGSYFEAQSD